jgi:transposase
MITQGGRPPTPRRTIFNGISYVLRTGCQWKMLPREYGSVSTADEHFQSLGEGRDLRQALEALPEGERRPQRQ